MFGDFFIPPLSSLWFSGWLPCRVAYYAIIFYIPPFHNSCFVLDMWWTTSPRSNVWLLEVDRFFLLSGQEDDENNDPVKLLEKAMTGISSVCDIWHSWWQQSTQGCSLWSEGWPGEKHVLNSPDVTMVGDKWRVGLLQLCLTAQCWYFPISGQMLTETHDSPVPMAGRSCWGSCQGSFTGYPTTQLSAVWRHLVSVGGISTTLAFNCLGT